MSKTNDSLPIRKVILLTTMFTVMFILFLSNKHAYANELTCSQQQCVGLGTSVQYGLSINWYQTSSCTWNGSCYCPQPLYECFIYNSDFQCTEWVTCCVQNNCPNGD